MYNDGHFGEQYRECEVEKECAFSQPITPVPGCGMPSGFQSICQRAQHHFVQLQDPEGPVASLAAMHFKFFLLHFTLLLHDLFPLASFILKQNPPQSTQEVGALPSLLGTFHNSISG